jgi:hypothetical protein
MDVTDNAESGGRFARRSVLGAGLGGAALSLLPLLFGRGTASASAPTTTAPPLRPTADDVTLLGFAQGVEMAARSLYDTALATSSLSGTDRDVILTIRESHDAYVQGISGLLGREAPLQVNADVVAAFEAAFAGSTADMLAAAYSIESTAVATHRDILGALQGLDGANLVASILIVEARHGTVLASMAGKSSLDELLVNVEADALAPAEG